MEPNGPLRLTDDQLAAVLRAAGPLAVGDRDSFVRLSADYPWRDERRGTCVARFADLPSKGHQTGLRR
jgi:hypothetical protein